MTHQYTYNIGYRGGSGGFLFLHFLLLSDQYYNDIFGNVDLSDVVKQQWNIANHSEWKNTEFWPNNHAIVEAKTDLDKLLYFCNPTAEDFFQKKYTVDIVAKWYQDIKDPAWPIITSVDDFVNLPQWISDEMYNTLECKNTLLYLADKDKTKTVWLYTDFDSQNELAYYKKAYFYYDQPDKEKIQKSTDLTETWQNLKVDKNAAYFLNHSDIQIKLQDLVNSPDSLIDHGLITHVSQKQHDLLKHWKSLHPPELLNKIGIK
jgi:hypothetical protein